MKALPKSQILRFTEKAINLARRESLRVSTEPLFNSSQGLDHSEPPDRSHRRHAELPTIYSGGIARF